MCGACECDQKQGEDTFLHKISSWLLTSVLYLGDFCQCSKDGGDSNQELEERCEAGGRVCSGHGTCDCGVCLCKSSKLRPEHFLCNGCLKSQSPNEAMSSMWTYLQVTMVTTGSTAGAAPRITAAARRGVTVTPSVGRTRAQPPGPRTAPATRAGARRTAPAQTGFGPRYWGQSWPRGKDPPGKNSSEQCSCKCLEAKFFLQYSEKYQFYWL